jgi:beta-N-acetylhexosaminidase
MICHRLESVRIAHETLARLPGAQLDRALANIAKFKQKLAAPDSFSEEEFQRRDADVYALRVATLGPEAAAHRSPEDGKRSPVELY